MNIVLPTVNLEDMMQKYSDLLAKTLTLKLTSCLGTGNPKAKLWVIGEAPGEEEEKLGIPFVGKSGNFLNAILETAGIRRADIYITNVSPVRPPENDPKKLDQLGITWEECSRAIQDLIETWKPNCILALGNIALQALCGKSGITEWRGTILPFDQTAMPVKVVPSFHPAHILRMGDKPAKKEREGEGGVKYTYGSARITLILDAKKAKEESQTRGLELPKRQLVWEPDYQLEFLFNFTAQVGRSLAFDIENKGSWIDRIAFAHDEGLSMSIALDQGPYKFEIKEAVQRILRVHPLLIAQNGSYDMTQLAFSGMPVHHLYADTMIAHHILYPELPHDLGYLASIYCKMDNILHPKGWDSPEDRGYYNALHASVTAEIWSNLAEELRELHLWEFFHNYQMPLFHILLRMYWRGVRVDLQALEEVRKVVGGKYAKAKEEWDRLTESKPELTQASLEAIVRENGAAHSETLKDEEGHNRSNGNQETQEA